MSDKNTRSQQTKTLLVMGLVAGPLFCVVVGLQLLTREGFDIMKHPLSLLSLGDMGWVQISNFVISGLLALAGAVGLRRSMPKGSKWGPLLIGVFGIGLMVAGMFLTDASQGFPIGAPQGQVAPSWHGTIHWMSAIVGLLAAIAGMMVYGRYLVSHAQKAWGKLSIAVSASTLIVSFWPNQASMGWRFAIAIFLIFVWLSTITVRALQPTGPGRR